MGWKAYVFGVISVLSLEGLLALVFLEGLRVGLMVEPASSPAREPARIGRAEPPLDMTPWGLDRPPVPSRVLPSIPGVEEVRP